jgi:hypothetical protein
MPLYSPMPLYHHILIFVMEMSLLEEDLTFWSKKSDNVEKCSLNMNFLRRFQCECARSGLRHFFGDHLGKVVTNSML